MKKLKIFLIINIFSFIFCMGNVKALTTQHAYYNNTITNRILSYSTLFDNIANYIRANASTFENYNSNIDITNNKNIIYYPIQNIASGMTIYLVDNIYIEKNTSLGAGVYRMKIRGLSFKVNYNSNYEVTGVNNFQYGTASTGWDNSYDGKFGLINYLDYRLGKNTTYIAQNATYGNYTLNLTLGPDEVAFNYGTNMNIYDLVKYMAKNIMPPDDPQYTMSQEILENGNVKLTFNFTNYDTNNGYGFTITNKVSGEEYGIANPFTSIYPNIIPFGNSYEIELSYDTIINVSLSKYTLIEGTELYDREPLYVDSYDISNIVFDNVQNPYFSIISQTQDNLIGRYNNTKNGDICGHIYSNNNVEWETNCNEVVDIDFSLNGYVEMYVKRNNNIIYSRKINYISQNQNQPYIIWNIEKQDFYSIVNWTIKNYDNQMTYRFSKDNGNTYTNWSNATENNYINVYDNNTIIIEIANNDQSIIYDTKAINVVNDISSLNNKNNTTNNIINKFNDIFNVNGNILQEIENYWRLLKNSKIYLIIFIPFITSIICAIIYLIRRA